MEGANHSISAHQAIEVNFPTAMVPESEFGVETRKSPIRFEPPLEGTFTWTSQTDGEFRPSKVPPGLEFKILVTDGLTDLAGKPVKLKEPFGSRRSDPFSIRLTYSCPERLDRRPSIPLTSTCEIRPADLAENAWFQDRDSRKRYPLEVVVEESADPTVRSATVTPRSDLPSGRTFDLIVENLKEAETGSILSQIVVIPLGQTDVLKVEKVAAFNYPMHRRRITVEFNSPVDPAEGRKIRIEPAVPGLECRAEGSELWFEGDYELSQRYTVTIPVDVMGLRGFATMSESRWGASFHPKKPAIIFPTEDLHQRSRLGLHFSFVQVNTGPLEWKLCRIPPEKLLAVSRRLREFTEVLDNPATGKPEEDEKKGVPVWKKTELLLEAIRLEPVAEGKVEASPAESDTRRDITWKPDSGLPAGAYVLEITGTNSEGKVIGNRALITFTEYAGVQKKTINERLIRIMHVGDGHTVPGVRVKAITNQNHFLAEAVTGPDGVARFAEKLLSEKGEEVEWFLLETPDGPMLQPARADHYGNSAYVSDTPEPQGIDIRTAVTTDRPLYRPGQVMHFKAFSREMGPNGKLRIPHTRSATWAITSSEGDTPVASGTAKLDDYGGLEGEWKTPATAKSDNYQLSVSVSGIVADTNFGIQEFRPPPFVVELTDSKLPGEQAGLRIASTYFHGAPNAGAHVRWKAVWTGQPTGDPNIVVTDRPRRVSVEKEHSQTAMGEGTLGANGVFDAISQSPFTDGVPRGWYNVLWSVDVTGLDGQNITESASLPVYAVPEKLEVRGQQVGIPRGAKAETMSIAIKAEANAPDGTMVANSPVSVELYKVINKSVKEEISPNVFRFRNSVRFEKGETLSGRTPFEAEAAIKNSGEYLLVLRNPDDPTIPVATQQVTVAGPGDAEFPVKDQESFTLACNKPAPKGDEDGATYLPGEKAVISVKAPFAGIAWVTVEAGSVIDSFTFPLEANSSRFEIPIKSEYAPNAWIGVYLLHPGGNTLLPAERFGSLAIKVRRPDLELKVIPGFVSKQVRPKDPVSGAITVTCEGHPVANADLTVYAVDEAFLDAGDWHEPPLRDAMYPTRTWGVATMHGLEKLAFGVDTESLHQKGFIIGGGETYKAMVAPAGYEPLRTNFPPLAYWQTHLKSDRNGMVPFKFNAPDGLTKYRVIALAQTKQNQFGTGSDWVEISKAIQIEPALPRFLRAGDELELRAIVRQRIADELPITLRCTTNLELATGNVLTQKIPRGLPGIFRFKARVTDLASARIRFETEAGPSDAVEIQLPVHPPTLLRKETVFGKLADLQKQLPPNWEKATGTAEVTVSTSPWLPKLTGLPVLLEYPHGCFEQITSRLMAVTVLNSLLDYLPEPAARRDAYEKRIAAGIDRMEEGLTPTGYLPYWPGGEPCALPTIAGYWGIKSAEQKGLASTERLRDSLERATESIAHGDKDAPADPFARAFALMVLSERGDAKALTPLIREMYERREKLDEEPRALLAIAMHRLGIMAKEKAQLLHEIDRPLQERPFDPDSFASTTRTEAIRAFAFSTIDPNGADGKARKELEARIDDSLDDARSLSTQENFWLLLAFKAMHPPPAGVPVDFHASRPAPAAISRNGVSALWSLNDIRRLKEFTVQVEHGEALNALTEVQYRSDSPVTERAGRGFRIERIVKNLTENTRTGSEAAPFHLGDEVLITYRLASPKLQHFVALEDELPAALETINPRIASIARNYSIPQEKDAHQLSLSFSELRDRTTYLYFDRIEPGTAVYSVLARATCAGTFRWPATQVTPMYDSRFSGVTPSSVCHVSGD